MTRWTGFEKPLDEYERVRYDRQIRIFGEEGQRRLRRAKIFVAGVGGLGSPVLAYLAAAGVGYLKFTDNDVIALSNLNRQILHWDRDVGEQKVVSAAKKLTQLSPRTILEPTIDMISESNVRELLAGAHAVVDAMDNYATRQLLNRACVETGVPFFHGAVHGLTGQVTTIIPGETPCFNCIFPRGPPPETFPVLGSTAGVIATIQATEVVKYLVGMGELLKGRLLFYDGEQMEFYGITVERDPRCPVCSKGRGQSTLTGPPAET